MKNIETRVAKLERQLPKDNFLVVIANKGEAYQDAIARVMEEMNIRRPIDDFFVIFLNLHGNQQIKKARNEVQISLNVAQEKDINILDLDGDVFLTC